MNSKTLYLVDVSSFIFRAFYAIRPLHTPTGVVVNAVYGVATMLSRVIEKESPEYWAIVYDSKEPSFRKERYSEYKANRSAVPEDLVPQFSLIEEMLSNWGMPSIRQSGVEADDLIATLTRQWLRAGSDHHVVILSGDKDLMQLVSDDGRVCVYDTLKETRFFSKEVTDKFGISPRQIRDYLSLIGDSSDNIPGVKGIGPKGAVELIQKWGTLDQIIQSAKDGNIPGKKGSTLIEQESLARLSYELVTLKDDLETRLSANELRFSRQVPLVLLEFLKRMNFHSLVQKWSASVASEPVVLVANRVPEPATQKQEVISVEPVEPINTATAPLFVTIQTEKELLSLMSEIEKSARATGQEVGFDLETTSLNPREAEIVGIALCYEKNRAYYIPCGHRTASFEQIQADRALLLLHSFLLNPLIKKVGQNLKYDISVLLAHGVRIAGIGADTMLAAYLLQPEGRHNLETLASRFLGYSMTTFEMICGKGAHALTFDMVDVPTATRYSAEDAWVALTLWKTLEGQLNAEGLMPVFAEIEMPLVSVLAEIEMNGICINSEWLQVLSSEFGKELREIEQKVATYTKGPVNLNSPKQLQHLLFDELKLPVQSKIKTGYSTDSSVLEVLAPLHEVPRLLMEYREIGKLKGTYVDPLPLQKDKKTQKIHAHFHQAVTATGRLSSSDPNLQNIPVKTERGKKIRKAFIPSPGCVLISADYSQIELRLLAHLSNDPELIAAFNTRNEDVHRRTASEIYSIPSTEVTEEQRSAAKAINFGLMYGKTAFGLAQELGLRRGEAQSMIDRYFTRYAGVKQYLDEQVMLAHERGWVVTLLGRKRPLVDIHSKNAAVRAAAERMAMNTPIQGTAADLMKLAMIHLNEKLEKEQSQARVVVQVHDEILIDCPEAELSRVSVWVKEILEGALQLQVPLCVNICSGHDWMEIS